MEKEELLEKARSYSEHHFSSQLRISGDTVYDHCLRVYLNLKKNTINDEVTLAAALLHPLCDAPVFDENNIQKEFGSEVALILKNYHLLKKSKIDKETPRAYNEALFIQTFLKLSGDTRTLVLRLADKLDNVQTAYKLNNQKRIIAAQKALYLYSVADKIIGLGRLSREMEDEAFKILNPREYKLIERFLNIRIHETKNILDDAQKYLTEILSENKINAKVTKRYKHIYGVYKKILQKRKPDETFDSVLNRIADIAGMRVVVDTVENCYLVENLILNTWEAYPEERNDYIVKPRSSGYQSLHGLYKLANNLNVEIQIRTAEMHEFNEFGPASHLLYKIGDKGAESLAYKKLLDYTKTNKYWFKELNLHNLESLNVANPITKAFSQNIYCFTPKGDILELKKDATVLDFAYSLHTDLGNKCGGAFINGVFVGLDHVIYDGDLIEIKVLKKNNVNRDWLKMAKMAKTKSIIRKALNQNVNK